MRLGRKILRIQRYWPNVMKMPLKHTWIN